jgi:long-chain acyl-CoA synthetase
MGSPDEPATLTHLVRRAAERFAGRTMVHRRGPRGWEAFTWDEMGARRQRVTAGLLGRGLGKGDRVGILSATRLEWSLADGGVLGFGGVVVGVYSTLTPDQAAYVLAHSGARALFVESPERLARLTDVLPQLPNVELIVLLEGEAPDEADDPDVPVITLDALVAEGEAALEDDADLGRRAGDAVEPEDIATIVYTSGTTSRPKGVVLSHGKLYEISRLQAEVAGIGPDDVGVAFLPLAHALTRVAGYSAAHVGLEIWFAESVETMVDTFRAAQPTTLALVPRVFEKMHGRIQATVAQMPARRQAIFRAALATGREHARRERQGEAIGLSLRAKNALFERLVFRTLRARTFGLRTAHVHSGGAPLGREVMEFFHAIGILILEGYGLTETSSPATLNRPDAYRFGTVGRPLPGVAVKIAEDGEVLIKSPGVFREYWDDPAATADAFTDDGWFKSGDIGEVDADGFLRITDRKKDVIITAGGKNVAPQPIENQLKRGALLSQAVVSGDRKPFLVALLTLDEEELSAWAEREGKSGRTIPELRHDDDVTARVAEHVEAVNASLARHETIKRWRILDRDFSAEDGTLTPSLKVKRRVVEERFGDVIGEMYDGSR